MVPPATILDDETSGSATSAAAVRSISDRAMMARAMGIPTRRPDRVSSTLEMLARAVCPPDDLDDAVLAGTLADTALMIDALAPPMRRGMRALITALELGAVRPRYGFRRFSNLTTDEARELLRTIERDQPAVWFVVKLLRDLVLVSFYEQPAVRASVGYEPDAFIELRKAARAQRWAEEIERHQQLLVTPMPMPSARAGAGRARRAGAFRSGRDLPAGGIDCDVVVVGSGAGGAVVAAELAEAGFDVVVLEEGGHHRTEDFTTSTTDMLRTLYRDAGVSATLGRTPIQYSEGRTVGGSTVVNGAMAFRASGSVLDKWADATGLHELARDGLDAEYARVERFLSVAPQDPESIGRDQHLMRLGAERLGWKVIDDTRAQVHCSGCNVCTWGCPTGAKQSMLVSYLPRAISFGADVWSDCRADRVIMRGKRAVGVEGRVMGSDGDERAFTVRARRVVVSCGAIHTPALLQRSGVRPPSGHLGRNLVVHPGGAVVAFFDEVVEGWKGAHQSVQVREFEQQGIVLAAVNLPPSVVARALPGHGAELGEAMRRYNHIVTAGTLVEDTGSGRVRAAGRDGVVVTYPLNDRDAAKAVHATMLLCQALFAAGARTIHLPIMGVPAVRGPDDLARVAATPIAPNKLVLSTVHLMGTARLGTDPTEAVCDPHGAVHDAADLYVADASLFPGPVGDNPMHTIMALATRVAAGIIEQGVR
jgi:choline dehydrogenase-like flavoprotein